MESANLEPAFTTIAYGLPFRMKTSSLLAFAPGAIVIGRPEATQKVMEDNYAFSPVCWPNSASEENALRDRVRAEPDFREHWATMQDLIGPVDDLQRAIQVLSWLTEFIPAYARWRRVKRGDTLYRPQVFWDDASIVVKGSIADSRANGTDTRGVYGNLKTDNDALVAAANRLGCDFLVSAHQIEPTYEGKKLVSEGGPSFGSSKERGMVGLGSNTFQFVSNNDYPDPYSTVELGGQSKIAIFCLGSTAPQGMTKPEFNTKSRWNIYGAQLPPSIRALAIRAGKEAILNRPPNLAWLDPLMYKVRDTLMEMPGQRITMEMALEAQDKVIASGAWQEYLPTDANKYPVVPKSIKEMDGQSPLERALFLWTRWAFQDGLALAIHARMRPRPGLSLKSIPLVPAPIN